MDLSGTGPAVCRFRDPVAGHPAGAPGSFEDGADFRFARRITRLIWIDLLHLACCVLQYTVGSDGRIRCGGLMRAEADADVEGSVEMQGDRGPELGHGLTLQAEEDGEGVAVLRSEENRV